VIARTLERVVIAGLWLYSAFVLASVLRAWFSGAITRAIQ